jgi:MtN3 and saliva related transmembrane protein
MLIIQTVVNIVFSTALFIHGFLFIPQVVKIWKKKSAENVSLITFAGFNVVQLSASLHGYFSKDWILMFGAEFSFITCAAVTLSIIWFSIRWR